MNTNTDPVRAHDELRVQAALLRTPEFMAQFDPEKFARQLERIATTLASAPPSASEPEVHSYDPTEQRQSVTIRWPDGKCLGYVLDRTRYTDSLPPSAPVGVEVGLLRWVKAQADDPDANPRFRELYSALAQQPAAPSGEVVAQHAETPEEEGRRLAQDECIGLSDLYGTVSYENLEGERFDRLVAAFRDQRWGGSSALAAQQQGGAK